MVGIEQDTLPNFGELSNTQHVTVEHFVCFFFFSSCFALLLLLVGWWW